MNLVVIAGRLAAPAEVLAAATDHRLVRLLLTVRSERPHARVDVLPVLWEGADDAAARWAPGTGVWVAGSLQRRFGRRAAAAGGPASRLEVRALAVEFRDPPEETVPKAR